MEREENLKTLKAICEEYDISKSYLCYIIREYREKGKESLKNTKYYSAEYKLKVIKWHLCCRSNERNWQTTSYVKHWFEDYQKRGEE